MTTIKLKYEQLIPGLPDEIAEHCILHLPYPYQSLVRSVSTSWNKAITNPNFNLLRKSISVPIPYVFVFSHDKSTSKVQWQAFDPRSRRWFILPPMPNEKSVSPGGFACVSVPKQGKLYVLGGMRSDTEFPLQRVISYDTATNKWASEKPMLAARAFFAAGCIEGKIFTAGGSGSSRLDNPVCSSMVECYDSDKDTWRLVAKMQSRLARYDAAVVSNKMYVTEGWTWPFSFTPRGWMYESKKDTWEEMKMGMREGWTGVSFVLDGERLFVISEHGDCRMKVYMEENDTWQFVGGERFPCEEIQRPFSVCAMEGKIYVAGSGLDVAVGSVYEDEDEDEDEDEKEIKGKLRVEWEVVKGPKAFQGFAPYHSQVVYG